MLVVPEGGSTFFFNMTHVLDGHTGVEHNVPVAPVYNDVLRLDIGSIEPGKLADLIVLNADPLANIRNTTAIRYVLVNGRIFDAETLEQLGNEPAPPPRVSGSRRTRRPAYPGITPPAA